MVNIGVYGTVHTAAILLCDFGLWFCSAILMATVAIFGKITPMQTIVFHAILHQNRKEQNRTSVDTA